MIEKFYLGTYTKRKSKGIYSIELDTTQKTLTNLKLEFETPNPTYLAKFDNKIFAVTQKKDLAGVLLIENNKAIAHNFIEQTNPCYIAYHQENNIILTANYHTTALVAYELKNNQINFVDKVNHHHTSIKPEQDKSHLHYCQYTPDHQFIVACDLGGDKLLTYQLDKKQFVLVNEYTCSLGHGARHLVFHPKLDIAYLLCELEASIEVLHYHKGEFSKISSISILDNAKQKWGAAIRISNDGKFLYASNRGDDKIAVFKIDDKGHLNKIQEISSYGSVVRDFNLSHNEKFLIAAHQESDNLVLFERKPNGLLEMISQDTFAPEVVCICK